MKVFKKTSKNISAAIAALLLLVFFLFGNVFLPVRASAAANVTDFSKTEILDDLADLDSAKYQPNENGKLEVIRFQEYCYSQKHFFKQFYGLFVYIYNPTCAELNVETCYISMATSYDADGKPKDWTNTDLIFCSATEDKLIYKFELDNAEDFLVMAKGYAELHDGERRYDMAGITIANVEDPLQDREYSWTYYFSGLAAGCGETTDSASTLTSRMEKLETLHLDVSHTNYRTEDFNADNVCDSLDSVYFSVPESYFMNYGGLQKIKAEWYEYKTSPIFVTADSGAYSALSEYVGKEIGENSSTLKWSVYWNYNDFDGYGGTYNGAFSKMPASTLGLSANLNRVKQLDWLFFRENVNTRDDYYVSQSDVYEYMKGYTKKFSSQEKIRGKYAEGLFADSIDEDRISLLDTPTDKRGYVVQEFDADELGDKQNLFYEVEQSDWDKFWKGAKFEEKTIDPILVFDQEDKTTLEGMTSATFAETHKVNPDEATSILEYCLTTLEDGARPVLFRFAVTDYYASTARFDSDENIFWSNEDGYVAQETVFLEFDIISLTFRAASGEETVIACVSDPMDIINGLTPPTDLDPMYWDWASLFEDFGAALRTIFGALVAILLIYGLISLIVWLIQLFTSNGKGGSSG